MPSDGVSVSPECVSTYNELRGGHKFRYIIFKLSDDNKDIIVDDSFGVMKDASAETEYKAFYESILGKQQLGKPAPRYVVYDFEYDAGDGEGTRNKITFISWSPEDAGVLPKMRYASSKEKLKQALIGIATEIQANNADDFEYKTVVELFSKRKI